MWPTGAHFNTSEPKPQAPSPWLGTPANRREPAAHLVALAQATQHRDGLRDRGGSQGHLGRGRAKATGKAKAAVGRKEKGGVGARVHR